MPALYRQYRPTTFAEIIGQDHITSILTQEILKKKVAHAYLFQGPRGTGKTTTARVFAKRLNCNKSSTSEPCDTCNSCIAFQQKASLDMIEIDAASNRGIDDIRALRETVSLAPISGEYKIYIIDEVHMLSGPAFAALLKTLEEPPRHVIFILATTELHKVPATIASRCQLFRFKRATNEEMKTRLTHLLSEEKRTADDEVISFITARSDGCYRDAESLLGQLLSHSDDTLTVSQASDLLGVPSPKMIEDFLEALVQGDAKLATTLATKAYADGFDCEQFIQESIRAARDGIVRNITNTNPPVFASAPNAIDRITVIMRAFLVALQDISIVPEPMIALELAILTSTVGVKREMQNSPTPAQRAPLTSPNLSFVRRGADAKSAPVVSPLPMGGEGILPQQEGEGRRPEKIAESDNPELLTKIQKSWEAIIQSLRVANPVASTFLRATQPKEVIDGALLLRAQFPLHKTFFEKPDNMQLVQKAIMDTIGEQVKIRCELDPAGPITREQQESTTEDLLKNVQEVFGVKVG
ncbi:MAG TPA: DNA polymerase III subunit gamma/tau [Candidatus Andersenbacteria bacterium]|nr:DNA polymerase III subunit gamma/tau [Candidatus Andersenbacteria bacterium]